MARIAVFAGLVVDEADNPVDVTYVGGVPHYVINDAGFFAAYSIGKSGSARAQRDAGRRAR